MAQDTKRRPRRRMLKQHHVKTAPAYPAEQAHKPSGAPSARRARKDTGPALAERVARWMDRQGMRFMALFVLLLTLSGYLNMKMVILQLERSREELRQENLALKTREAELLAEIERLQAPKAVEEAARALGMTYPDEPPYLLVQKPQVVVREIPPPPAPDEPTLQETFEAGMTLLRIRLMDRWVRFWQWVDQHTPSL